MQQCHQCGVSLDALDRFCRGCGAASDSDERLKDELVGRVIAGSYVVQELVGVGGMGRVYRAEQRMLGRTVAIKVVHPHLLSDEQSVSRFYTEARAASRLNHPNSVSIIDFGRTDDGILYLVMEFLKGRDLSRLMQEDGALPHTRICEIASAVLDALAEAHALSVVHRDLKPENVIIERLRSGGDLVKVVDFGLAKLLGGPTSGTGITLPGLVCGTPDYMSPEQGRGEEVDARGDIYSVGVMLFEMVTGQLPFLGDTPTNVVLKHIQDDVPDPRETAPDQEIPDGLAVLIMRALAKSPAQRFQSADDMAASLRSMARGWRPLDAALDCPACGHKNAITSRFCADCGGGLSIEREAPPHAYCLPPRFKLGAESVPLIARDVELEQIERWREESVESLLTVVVLGDVGIGRSRFLAALCERAVHDGDLVVGSGPHPSGAPVPYYSILSMVQSVLGLGREGLADVRDELAEVAPLVSAGMDELIDPVGLRGSAGEARAAAVAAALLFAIDSGLSAGQFSRALVVIDDLNLCDGLTQQVVSALLDVKQSVPIALVVTDHAARDRMMVARAQCVELRGLTLAEAEALLAGRAYHSEREPDPDDEVYLPLIVEQIRAVGGSLSVPGADGRARLADAVSQRLRRLALGARRLLQAVAVLGNSCERSQAEKLNPDDGGAHVKLLTSQGLLVAEGSVLHVAHPFVRDLVEASMPAEARKILHAQALAMATENGEALEVRASHAFGSGEALGALVLLERMGDLALGRGDVGTAVLGYQRALSLSRRELLETGDSYLEGAIESISRRLGLALIRRGDITGAEGVLREALEYAAPSSTHRAQILIGLAEVLAAKQRMREAYRTLGQALEIAIHNDAEDAQVDVQMVVARLRRSEGNLKGAVAALRTAEDLLSEQEHDQLHRARAAVEVARNLADLRAGDEAEYALEVAARQSENAGADYLSAQVFGIDARLARAGGDLERSQELYARAGQLAESAGDGKLAVRFRSLSITQPAEHPPESIPGQVDA